ncbi:esterase [Nocardia puris]|uniref:LGFP repeat-containing protein n=1 Tax=Nocardia puris TaxID=208602 RepID=UPI001893A03A|nr:esterase [Nocardia puris]MBF6210779.1 esterase [Nocardia puris]MBF6364374.1 esterase [Nocardia puris]MBF6459303.1 esterase [Nocardia puris]
MHHARRTAGFTIALAAAGLLIAGCGDDTDGDGDSATTTTAAAATTTHAGDHTTSPDGTAMPAPGGAAGEQTTIATPGGAEVTISGDIYEKYLESGGLTGPLGAPEEAEETGPNNGRYQDFVGGTIYEPEEGEPHIVWGLIREAWEENGGANGDLGYPTSDETDVPGGKQSEFTGGTITWINGEITVTRN